MFKTLYIRLAVVFLALTSGIVLVVGWQSIQSATRYVDETEQKLNADLANVLAIDFQPFLVDSIDHASIRSKIEYFIGINPRIDIYLLGNTGMIKALFVPSGKEPIMGAINTEPLDQFMNGEELPLLGQDPLLESGMKPFSVAPLEIMGEQGCYLYVVLGGDQYDTSSATIQESYILRTLFRNLLLVLLISTLVGLLLFGQLTRRLSHISTAVKQFSAGKYGSRIDVKGRDEVAILASSVNGMVDTLEDNIQRLETTDRQRRELVANISHDLRSPLSSIRGYLETILIKAHDASREDIQQYAEIGMAGTERLSRLVEDLFELSKLDANQVSLQQEAFSLSDLLQDVVQQFNIKADQKGIVLNIEFPDEKTLANGDIALVERALSNLIDNAIKYSEENSEVRIAAFWDGNKVQIEVEDFGKGIPEEELPLIFDRFYRIDKSRNHAEGGAGLGLAIAKKIVELHNSTLSVSSKLNSGTTFRFWLPSVGFA